MNLKASDGKWLCKWKNTKSWNRVVEISVSRHKLIFSKRVPTNYRCSTESIFTKSNSTNTTDSSCARQIRNKSESLKKKEWHSPYKKV